MNSAIVPTDQTAVLAPNLPFDPAILAGQLAASSIRMYRRDYLAYLHFAGSPAAAIDPITLARWRATLATDTALSPNTINRMLSAVKRVMTEAAQQGYLAAELAAQFADVPGVRVVALNDRVKPHARTRIAPSDMRRLCDAPPTTLKGMRDRALLATLASSGIRVSEAASLQQVQIIPQGPGYLLRVRGKNDPDYRLAPLSMEAHGRIQAWLQARPLASSSLFTAFAGRGAGRATPALMTAQGV